MSGHSFRNPDILQVLPYREAIRKLLPNGCEGFVVEDLDLVVRWHGARYGTDDTGMFMLCEIKHGGRKIDNGVPVEIEFSKEMTFGMIDNLLKIADPYMQRYKGFYVIRTFGSPNWNHNSKFMVNGISIEYDNFFEWLDFKISIPPYQFKPKFQF